MNTLQVILPFLFLHVLVADDILANVHKEEYAGYNRYARERNDLDLDTSENIKRSRRQTPTTEMNYVTQCGYDNHQQPDGPSVQVLGISLEYPGATLVAAKLVHLLVRFMPRQLFLTIAEKNTVGLFPSYKLPAELFLTDFPDEMRRYCGGGCQNRGQVDCSQWCTTTDYPYQPLPYSINYLWAYGNFSRLFVVETNVICQGFNPAGTENLLMKEFGLMMMSRILDEETVANIRDAYNTASANSTWQLMTNEYEYFMLGTLAWFNGAGYPNTLKGMACMNIFANNGLTLCSDVFGQRQFIKSNDVQLYKILNYVYNNNREYVNAETSVCEW